MSFDSFDFSRSPEGEIAIRRKEGRPPIGDFVIPGSTMATMGCYDPCKLGHILLAASGYMARGSCVLPAEAAEVAQLLIGIISAAEDAVDKGLKISQARQQAALARWGTRENAELDSIDTPLITIPRGLQLPPIQTGGVDIHAEEYIRTMEIFLIRGFEPEQHLAFYYYFGRKHWLDGAIGTIDARMNRAQRWQQLDGPKRFDADPAAHTLFVDLLNALPEDKRIYLLGDRVQVSVDSTAHVSLMGPKELYDAIKPSEAASAAIGNYCRAHGLSLNDGWGFVSIPFIVKTRR